MLQREFQRFEGVVEADYPYGATQFARDSQDGHGVGCGAESHVPNYKFAAMFFYPLDQAKLPHVQRFRLRYGADDRMERLGVGKRMDAMRAIGEFNDAVSSSGGHPLTFHHRCEVAKRKEAGQARPRLYRSGFRYRILVAICHGTAETWPSAYPASPFFPCRMLIKLLRAVPAVL